MLAILHIDTASSRELYKDVSPVEKSRCAKFLKEYFEGICRKYRGTPSKWEGDGGFALFPFNTAEQIKNVFEASKSIVEGLPQLNAQTAKYLNWESFPRQVRLKAHKGEVVLTNHRGLDSADPKDFDDFLKHEKKFAPRNDELFVTHELHHHLSESEKKRFRLFKQRVKGGSLCTDLYRLCRAPVEKAEDILRRGDEVSAIRQSDWKYLRNQITAHFANIAARNQITKNLISYLSSLSGKRRGINSGVIFDSTLDALYSYTHIIFPNCRIRISYWRAVQKNNHTVLKMVSYRYPDGESTNPTKRVVSIEDRRYKVCECFLKKEPVVTPCVTEARLEKSWHDFGPQQVSEKRALDSALQIPVYCESPVGQKR